MKLGMLYEYGCIKFIFIFVGRPEKGSLFKNAAMLKLSVICYVSIQIFFWLYVQFFVYDCDHGESVCL
jgi:hypothetical protein